MKRSTIALVAFVLVAMLVPILRAAPAAAAATCPPGFSLSGTYCLDMQGRYGGYINNGKLYTGGSVPAGHTPAPVNKPSSVLRAANGSGGSVSSNSLRARANGLATKLNLAPKIGQAYMVVQAGQLGFTVGKGLAAVGCDWGFSALCYPTKADNFAPNADVGPATQPGWNKQCVVADSTAQENDYQGQALHVEGCFSFGASPPTLGAKPTAGSVRTALRYQASTSAAYGSGYTGFTQMAAVCRKPWTSALPASAKGPDGLTLDNSGTNWTAYIPYRQPAGGPYQLTISNATGADDRVLCNTYDGVEGLYQGPLNSGGIPTTKVPLVQWYADGSAYRAPTVSSNPTRTLRTVNTCSNGSSTQKDSDGFKETDAAFPTYPVAPACTSGALVKVEVFEKSPGLADKLIWSMNVPQVVSDWAQGTGNNFTNNQPACFEGGCQLRLYKIAGDNQGDCFADVGRCVGWFEDPNKTTNYQCTYGPPGTKNVVDLNECYVYSGTFDPKNRAKGVEYCDPADGKCPDQVGDPSDPGKTPGGAGSDDGSSGSDDPSCYPSGWSVFNPIEWIVRPITCILKYLFIPGDSAFSDLADGLNGAIGNTSLSAWGSSLSGVGSLTGIASNGCGGATLHMPDFGMLHTAHDYSIFSTCDQPWSGIALVVKALITLAIAWGTIMTCYRIIAAAFGLELPAKASA